MKDKALASDPDRVAGAATAGGVLACLRVARILGLPCPIPSDIRSDISEHASDGRKGRYADVPWARHQEQLAGYSPRSTRVRINKSGANVCVSAQTVERDPPFSPADLLTVASHHLLRSSAAAKGLPSSLCPANLASCARSPENISGFVVVFFRKEPQLFARQRRRAACASRLDPDDLTPASPALRPPNFRAGRDIAAPRSFCGRYAPPVSSSTR